MYNPKQGDIVFLDFSPQSGHEQAGRRPGVVISNEQFLRELNLLWCVRLQIQATNFRCISL